ncbi:MAG: flagellar biosynthetic protein FliO [Gammaproteobacteria bacterium]|nr:flagellar biosynthetic protein FliO [Gammaproteobacteria bacterium]
MRDGYAGSFLRGSAGLGSVLLAVYGGVVRAAETATNSNVPALGVEPLAGGSLAKMGLGLFAVVFLIVGMAWLMRRMGGMPGTATGSLRVLGGLSMGTRERVVLIQVGETQLLLGVAPGRVQTLHVLDQPIATTEPGKSGKNNFAASLAAALQRRNKS